MDVMWERVTVWVLRFSTSLFLQFIQPFVKVWIIEKEQEQSGGFLPGFLNSLLGREGLVGQVPSWDP